MSKTSSGRYYQWSPQFDLITDLDVQTVDGTKVMRVTIPSDFLIEALAQNQDGTRFFLNRVASGLRGQVPRFSPQTIGALSGVRGAMSAANVQHISAEDILGNQFLELEKRFVRAPRISGYLLPIGPQG